MKKHHPKLYRPFERWHMRQGRPRLTADQRLIISAIEYRRRRTPCPRIQIIDPDGVDSTPLLASYLEYWHSLNPWTVAAVYGPRKGHPVLESLKESIGAYTASKEKYYFLHGFDFQAALVIGRTISLEDDDPDDYDSDPSDVSRASASALAVLCEDSLGLLLVRTSCFRTSCFRSDAPRCCLTPPKILPPQYFWREGTCRREGFQPSHPRPSKQKILLFLLSQIFLEKPLSFNYALCILNYALKKSPSGPPHYALCILHYALNKEAPPAK